MLMEVVEYLVNLGRLNASPVVTVPGAPPNVFYVRQPDGTLKLMNQAAPSVAHTLYSLDSFARLAAAWGDGLVWYSHAGATLQNDDFRATYATVEHPVFATVRSIAAGTGMYRQDQLLTLLRTTFRDCLPANSNLVELLRRVKLKAGQTADSEVQPGRVSLGKTMTAELTGAGVLPEYLTLSVPVFANADLPARAAVEFVLDPVPAQEQFLFRPLPGQVEAAQAAAVADLAGRLADALAAAGAGSVPAYHGRP